MNRDQEIWEEEKSGRSYLCMYSHRHDDHMRDKRGKLMAGPSAYPGCKCIGSAMPKEYHNDDR